MLELSQLSMCTEWPRAATYRLVWCWNRSNLAPGSAHTVSREGHVTGKSGHACSGGSDDVISWRGRRRVIEVSGSGAWAWPVGADTHGHVLRSAIKTRARRRSRRTDERGQLDREWVWWLEADSWSWAWPVGADTHGHVLRSAVKTGARRQWRRTDGRGQLDREWVWWLEADSW